MVDKDNSVSRKLLVILRRWWTRAGVLGLASLSLLLLLALSSCNLNQFKQANQLKPTRSNIQKFQLADLGLTDYHLQETDEVRAKETICEFIHNQINLKNGFMNGTKIALKQNHDYVLIDYEKLPWKDFVDLSKFHQRELIIRLKTVATSHFLMGRTSLKVINHRNLNERYDLTHLNSHCGLDLLLNDWFYPCNEPVALRSSLKKLTQTINDHFCMITKKEIKQTDWLMKLDQTRVGIEELTNRLVANYVNGAPIRVTIQATKKSTKLINQTHFLINTAAPKMIHELPENYTVNDYASAINHFKAFVQSLSSNKIVDEIKKVLQKLSHINQSAYWFYDTSLFWMERFIKEYRNCQKVSGFSKFNFQKLYQILAAQVNTNFYAPATTFIQSARNQRDFVSILTINEYFLAALFCLQTFAAVKSEFYVNQLLILCNQFVKKNSVDLSKWILEDKFMIVHLAHELTFWLRFNVGRIHHDGRALSLEFTKGVVTSTIPLANLNFLSPEILQFENYFTYRENQPYLLIGDWLLYRKAVKLLPNEPSVIYPIATYNDRGIIPFASLSGTTDVRPNNSEQKKNFKKLNLGLNSQRITH